MIEKQGLAQQLAVEIGRQAQNETLLDTKAPGKSQRNLDQMGNVDLDVNIFANAANYLCQILHADGCAIFDLSEFRMTHSSPTNTRSHGSSSFRGEAKHQKSSLGHKRKASYDAADTASPVQSNGSSLFQAKTHNTNTNKEHFMASGGGKSHCSYFPSSNPIRVLGHSGHSSEHFYKLQGDVSKPVVAKYLSMTRSSGLNSKAFVENRTAPEWGLSVLAPENSKTTICCSVAEADSQPAFLIFAYFSTEDVHFDRTEELFVEQLGAYLIYSSIRSRVIAVNRAQMRFTQRIQHELRTPLHAIIGVNEIAKQSLDESFNFTEMKEMIDTIATSADSLNFLVDDMVDFSLMERLSGERKLLQMEKVSSDWETICSVISSTCIHAFTLCRRLSKVSAEFFCLSKVPALFC